MLDLFAVDGLRLAAVASGIKKGRDADLALIEVVPGTNCAAVFTKNLFICLNELLSSLKK